MHSSNDTALPPAGEDGTYGITHRRVLGIAVPMTLAYLSTPILGIVDTTVIGRLGDAALLGGIAVGAILFDLVFTTFNFLRSGTTGLTAQALGARDHDEIRDTFYRALFIGVLSGVLLILFAPLFLAAGLWFMGASDAVNQAVEEYYLIRVLSSPFALANYVVLGWFIGLGRAGIGLLLQVLLNGINIVLNIWFVMGLGWGIAGVAWGTFVGEFVTCVVGIVLVMRAKDGTLPTDLKTLMMWSRFKRLLALNGDIMIRSFALIFAFAYFTRLGAGQGDVILGANAVLMNFFLTAGYFLDGFATAAEQLAGQSIGARLKHAFKRAVRLCLYWGFALAGAASFAFLLIGPTIIDLMTTAPEVREAARHYLLWAAMIPLAGVLAFQFDGVFIGATWSSDMRNMMLVSLVAYLVSAHALTPLLDNHGLWLSLYVFLIVRGITLSIRYPYRLRGSFKEEE